MTTVAELLARSRDCWNGSRLAINRGRLWLHESGTFVELTQAGADLFAQG